jgi:hypothetical protein
VPTRPQGVAVREPRGFRARGEKWPVRYAGWDAERLGHGRLAVLERDESHALGGVVRAIGIELAEALAALGDRPCQISAMPRGEAVLAIALARAHGEVACVRWRIALCAQ